jgi:hypothetical protein
MLMVSYAGRVAGGRLAPCRRSHIQQLIALHQPEVLLRLDLYRTAPALVRSCRYCAQLSCFVWCGSHLAWVTMH